MSRESLRAAAALEPEGWLVPPPYTDRTHHVLECDRRPTPLGPALRIQIERHDGCAMPWRELWDVFEARYPGCWAVQILPPRELLLDQAHKYHLFVYDHPLPDALDIGARPPIGTEEP